jgi:release factor glutamine methyltransferase
VKGQAHFQNPTVSQLIRDGEIHLVVAGVPNARRNAEWMLADLLRCRAADLYLDATRAPDAGDVERYRELIERRSSREPLQYILGHTEFMSLPFRSRPGVFIPRPDTECLVEIAEARLNRGAARVLDLCCGSGVIAVSLLRRHPDVTTVAVDVDAAAGELTIHNAEANGVHDRMRFVGADAAGFLEGTDERFDMVACNPPYIATGEMNDLPPEVRDHEPWLSLDGGADGLDFYRGVAGPLCRCLKPGASVLFEIGSAQAAGVRAILEAASLVDIEVHQDYAGCDRVVVARPLEWAVTPASRRGR